MPQAVAHILFPLIIMSLIRDYYIDKKGRKSFPLRYVLIAGIAGIIPDLDVAAFWVLSFAGVAFNEVHRTFLHTLFIPIIFLFLSLFLSMDKFSSSNNKFKWNMVFAMLAFGSATHILLDGIFTGQLMVFYPLSYMTSGLDLFGYLPGKLAKLAAPCLDALLFVIYMVYLEVKHKISDFI